MRIAVVVSCYRQERFLPRTLAAIETALATRDWEGVLELAVRNDEPRPVLSERWKVVSAFDPATGRPGRALTPGAGRMLGFESCGGDWVLFVDSDVEVQADWMRRAIEVGEREPGVGAVFGRLEEWFADDSGERCGLITDMYRTGNTDRPVDYLAALAFYRRSALRASGGYDPRLNSDEDFELGLRFRRLGLEMRSLGQLAGRHWSAPRPTFAELGRRWATGITLGQGQVLRLYLFRPGFGTLLARQKFYVGGMALWLLGLAALVLGFATGDFRWSFRWLALPIGVIALMALKKRDLRRGALSLATWTVNGLGMIRGFVSFPSGERPLPVTKEAAC